MEVTRIGELTTVFFKRLQKQTYDYQRHQFKNMSGYDNEHYCGIFILVVFEKLRGTEGERQNCS